MNEMLCVLFLFCSSIVGGGIPTQEGQVSYLPGFNVLLAHNYLDGHYFANIEPGNTMITYGTKRREYVVTEVIVAQAEEPDSPQTMLWIDGQWMNPVQMYYRAGILETDTLVLITCAEGNGLMNWGRRIIIGHEIR